MNYCYIIAVHCTMINTVKSCIINCNILMYIYIYHLQCKSQPWPSAQPLACCRRRNDAITVASKRTARAVRNLGADRCSTGADCSPDKQIDANWCRLMHCDIHRPQVVSLTLGRWKKKVNMWWRCDRFQHESQSARDIEELGNCSKLSKANQCCTLDISFHSNQSSRS